jgi:hypothetical protein
MPHPGPAGTHTAADRAMLYVDFREFTLPEGGCIRARRRARTEAALRPDPLQLVVGSRLALLDPDRITTADRAALHHCTIDTDIDLIVLSRCAQDARIFR